MTEELKTFEVDGNSFYGFMNQMKLEDIIIKNLAKSFNQIVDHIKIIDLCYKNEKIIVKLKIFYKDKEKIQENSPIIIDDYHWNITT